MIGLAGLPDGGCRLSHPLGTIWVLVRKGWIVRAELWDPERLRFAVFPPNPARAWALNFPNAAADVAKGVRLAD
jgi:hypothetical protein